jgi:signal transduction histidine kinase
MGSSRPVPWVSPLLCAAVLVAGTYYALVASGPSMRTAAFVGGLLLLMGLDVLERRVPAVALLALRVALCALVNVLDVSGVSRVLFVLVPFTAYFAFGRRVAVALGVGFTAALPVVFTLWVPDWYVRSEYISDLLMFGLGNILALTMAAVAVGEQRARVRLEGTLREVEELSAAQERNRLAREIHDSLGHHLTAIGIQLEKAEAFADLDPAGARRALEHARWSAGRALDEVRQSVRTLGDRAGPFRLTAALTELIAHLDDGQMKIDLDVTGEEEEQALGALTALYRAAQEALTNACRHSSATRVRLSVAYEASGARLVVADDGQGFDTRRPPEGFGLKAMRERVRRLGGRVDITSAPGGTVISVTVPW